MPTHDTMAGRTVDRRGRLATLDALRDLAAIVVVLHHTCSRLTGVPIARHGYLAVDFFFLLSGFVIARTYEPRWRRGLGTTAFVTARLRRLCPLMMVGVLLGFAITVVVQGLSPSIVWLLACAFLFIPRCTAGADFPLDGTQWSLMVELLLNLVHALALRRLGLRALAALTLLAGAAIPMLAWRHGHLRIGDMGDTVFAGPVRAAFPYLCGVLLWRLRESGRLPRLHVTGTAVAATLLLVLFGAEMLADAIGWAADPLLVLVVMPLLVWAGADAEPRTAMPAAWGISAGSLSYPLYALHLPLNTLAERLAAAAGLHPGPAILALYLAVTIGIAWLIARHANAPRDRSTVASVVPAHG